MNPTLQKLVDRLNDSTLREANVIPWGCPVPAFGDPARSSVATLGLNPSNREFVDGRGNELDGASRRFHTLRSLGLDQWSNAGSPHISLIVESCQQYFNRNPYDGWFRALDQIISGTRYSYYGHSECACHLDLIPYATSCKWIELTARQRLTLLNLAGDTLGLLLLDTPIQILVLNGQTVVNNLQLIAKVSLEQKAMRDWNLPRKCKPYVPGFAYTGVVREIGGVKLGRNLGVLGFNHNIQSSFGVTNGVRHAIRNWVGRCARKLLS